MRQKVTLSTLAQLTFVHVSLGSAIPTIIPIKTRHSQSFLLPFRRLHIFGRFLAQVDESSCLLIYIGGWRFQVQVKTLLDRLLLEFVEHFHE